MFYFCCSLCIYVFIFLFYILFSTLEKNLLLHIFFLLFILISYFEKTFVLFVLNLFSIVLLVFISILLIMFSRIGKAPADIAEQWAKMKKDGTDRDRALFVDKVARVARGDWSDVRVFITTIISKEEGSREEARWKSFERMCTDHGRAVTLSILKHKTLPIRANPKVVPGSVEFPECRQFYDDDTIDFKHNSHKTQLEFQGPSMEVSAEVAQEMITAATHAPSSGMHHPGPVAEPLPADLPPQVPEAVKTALQVLSKTHAEWDRKRREFQGCVAKSKMHEQTAGSFFEKALEATIRTGGEQDHAILDMELQLKQCTRPQDVDESTLDSAAAMCSDLAKLMKTAQQQRDKLKSWF